SRTGIFLSVFGLFVGLVLHLDALMLWPIASSLIGMICGLAAFMPDQSGNYGRFLGEQRLPVRQFWALKSGFWLLTALWVILLIGVGAGIRTMLAGPMAGSHLTGLRGFLACVV